MAGFLTVAKGVSLEKSSPEFPVKDEYRNSPVKVLSQTSGGIFANYLVLKSTEKQHRDCEGVVYLPSTLLCELFTLRLCFWASIRKSSENVCKYEIPLLFPADIAPCKRHLM